MIEISLEIHFPQKNEVSLRMETNCAPVQEEFAQRLLISLMGFRHMLSMGVCLLSGEIGQLLYRATPEEFKDMVKSEEYKGIRFVPYDQPARKHLKATLRYDDNSHLEFAYKSYSLGINPKSTANYCTISLQALLRHLVKDRCSDTEFLEALAETCKITGALFIKGVVYEYNIKEAAVLATTQTMEALMDKTSAAIR
ncbi:MAG: hypothetical protein ACYCX4_10515 [Bacillota bacterium]